VITHFNTTVSTFRAWLSPPLPSQACYCSDHSQRIQGLIEVFCFPAFCEWVPSSIIQCIRYLCCQKGVSISLKISMLFMHLRELFITGICILLQPNGRRTLRVDSDVRDGSIGFNHEYPAYCSLNTNHPLAWLLSGSCESPETADWGWLLKLNFTLKVFTACGLDTGAPYSCMTPPVGLWQRNLLAKLSGRQCGLVIAAFITSLPRVYLHYQHILQSGTQNRSHHSLSYCTHSWVC